MTISENIQKSRSARLKKSIIFFWLDEFEVYLNDYISIVCDKWRQHNFKWIDEDNSADYYLKLYWKTFSVSLTHPKGFWKAYQFRTVVEWVSVSLFMIRYPSNFPEWKISLVIYSSFFVLQDLLDINISLFIQDKFKVSPYGSMRRFDIALDTTIPVKTLKNQYFSNTEFSAQIWKDTKHKFFHQTYYIWNIQTSTNRKYLFRIYDKVLDTWKKNKWFLYSHLRENPEVRRIELEMRSHEAARQEYSYIDILENRNWCVEKIFFHYLNKNWDLDIPVHIPLKSYKFTPFDLKTDFLATWIIPERYLAQVRWYNRKVLENCWNKWLFQVLCSSIKYAPDWTIKQISIHDELERLSDYVSYMKETWIHKSLIKKTLKSHL